MSAHDPPANDLPAHVPNDLSAHIPRVHNAPGVQDQSNPSILSDLSSISSNNDFAIKKNEKVSTC